MGIFLPVARVSSGGVHSVCVVVNFYNSHLRPTTNRISTFDNLLHKLAWNEALVGKSNNMLLSRRALVNRWLAYRRGTILARLDHCKERIRRSIYRKDVDIRRWMGKPTHMRGRFSRARSFRCAETVGAIWREIRKAAKRFCPMDADS